MAQEFIILNEIAQGPVAVRHSEIVWMETLPSLATRVYISTGDRIIVMERQSDILCLIRQNRE